MFSKDEVGRWVADLGLKTPADKPWVIAFRLSTVPMRNWFYSRNQLKPNSIKLDLTVTGDGRWLAQLDRHDRLFQAQWRPGDDLRIESQQLKYRRLVPWPRLLALKQFPQLVPAVEAALGVSFIRHVDIGSKWLHNQTLLKHPGLRAWLALCADSAGEVME